MIEGFIQAGEMILGSVIITAMVAGWISWTHAKGCNIFQSLGPIVFALWIIMGFMMSK